MVGRGDQWNQIILDLVLVLFCFQLIELINDLFLFNFLNIDVYSNLFKWLFSAGKNFGGLCLLKIDLFHLNYKFYGHSLIFNVIFSYSILWWLPLPQFLPHPSYLPTCSSSFSHFLPDLLITLSKNKNQNWQTKILLYQPHSRAGHMPRNKTKQNEFNGFCFVLFSCVPVCLFCGLLFPFVSFWHLGQTSLYSFTSIILLRPWRSFCLCGGSWARQQRFLLNLWHW